MFKYRYTSIPACITSGPMFMTKIGGLLDGWAGIAVSLLGACMVSAALGMMCSIIFEQMKERQMPAQDTN
jgi:hypothetical protein